MLSIHLLYEWVYFCVLQKFFDLERENVCATKEQKDHAFPKLNRNKYMVTDGAAYIGRCQPPQGTVRVSGGPTVLFRTPWGPGGNRRVRAKSS